MIFILQLKYFISKTLNKKDKANHIWIYRQREEKRKSVP